MDEQAFEDRLEHRGSEPRASELLQDHLDPVPHQHEWKFVAFGPHFITEPNSKRQPKRKGLLRCECGQRAYRVMPKWPEKSSLVIYTWDKDPANWVSEADNWGLPEAVTERLRATQTRQLR